MQQSHEGLSVPNSNYINGLLVVFVKDAVAKGVRWLGE